MKIRNSEAYFRRLKKQENRGIWLCRVLLVGVILGYSSLYFNNTYPISEGWGAYYAELLFAGKVPYRDFYYYLPPLSLFLDALLWLLSFGSLLVFRAWRVLERIVIYVMIFNLLKRYFHYTYAFAACALTAIISTGDVYDLLGDYNQTMALLAVLLMYFALGFVENKKKKDKYRQLFFAGIVLGAMFLNKQTIFLACFLSYFAAISLRCLVKKDTNYPMYLLFVALGVLIPIGIASAYLLLNGAFMPFVEQVFLNVDGKGSLFRIIVEGVAFRLKSAQSWAILGLLGALFYIATLHRDSIQAQMDLRLRKLMVLLSLVLVCVLLNLYQQNITKLISAFSGHTTMLVCFLLAMLPYGLVCALGRLSFLAEKQELLQRLKLVALFAGSAAILFGTACSEALARKLYRDSGLFAYIQSDLQVICMLGTLIIMAWYLLGGEYKRSRERLYFMACAGFSLFYAGIMASGASGGPAHIIRIALPFLLCVVFAAQIPSKPAAVIVKGGTWLICMLLCMTCVAQKVECSYSWWGSTMEPISQKTYTTDIPALKGIRMSEARKELYETVTDLIEENSDEDAFVWGYPHNKLFNILTDRYTMETFVPVLFYDVTADQYVLQELEMLQSNLPDIVVWQHIPNVLNVHEEIFREGEPLKHRELETFFAEVLPEKYTLIGTVSDVSVYRLNDGVEPASTSFADGLFSWFPVKGTEKATTGALWGEKTAVWTANSGLPAEQTVKLHLYYVPVDADSTDALTVILNGETVEAEALLNENGTMKMVVDVLMQPGANSLELGSILEPDENGKCYCLKGLYFTLVEE